SHEGGELEDPWNEPTKGVWTMTVAPEDAPNEPEYVAIEIEQGKITKVNGEALSPYKALMALNEVAGAHGVGRVDITENRLVGMKSRGCYETPGGTVMYAALRAIEELVLDKTSREWREQVGAQMAHLVYDGRWFTPLCESLLGASKPLADLVNGEVIIKLYKGQASAVKKRSPNSLYSEEFATFGDDNVYNQKDAEGFIRLYSLASRIRSLQGLNK
ncbi:MAG: argininosuccinate synthase, partial [Shewanella sp.]